MYLVQTHLNILFQLIWISIIPYNLGLVFVKTSILFQYQTFFVHTVYRKICWVAIVCVIAYGTAAVTLVTCTCTPISYFWNKTIPGGHCIDLTVLWFCNASWNIFTDLVIIILPMRLLHSLNLPKLQIYILEFVFALGGL